MKRKRRPQLQLLPGLGLADTARVVTPLARATSRAKSSSVATTPKPWLAAVLAVDTARHSGWAIHVCGERKDSGELDTLDTSEVDRVVRWAVQLAELGGVPLVLVLETPWGGNVHIVAALGVARERWLRAWRDAGQVNGRVVKVMPSQWRGPVLGREWVSAPREEVRAHEQRVVRALMGRAVGPDEAPAILIARWASHAAAVGKAIGKRAAKASLRQWTQP